MRYAHFALSLLAAAVLAACGGDDTSASEQALKTQFSAMVSFGDNLSDVGTYNVGTIKALGGGKFTINGNNTAINPALTGKNWTELMAAQFGLAPPCAAQTGLDGDAAKGFSVPEVNNPGCLSYAQGGSRVSHPVGPGHKLTGSALGLLTMPVQTQITTHLNRSGGKFSGTEVVFVTVGANDVLMLLGQMKAAATAAGQTAGAAYAASQAPVLVTGRGRDLCLLCRRNRLWQADHAKRHRRPADHLHDQEQAGRHRADRGRGQPERKLVPRCEYQQDFPENEDQFLVRPEAGHDARSAGGDAGAGLQVLIAALEKKPPKRVFLKLRQDHWKAWIPVIARPKISAWISCVPS